MTATLLLNESAREFAELGADLMEEHAPQSATRAELVTIFATTLLRFRRAPTFEAAIVKGAPIPAGQDCWVDILVPDASADGLVSRPILVSYP